MDEDRLSNAAFSQAVLDALGLRVPDYEEKQAAALERERRDPVPRSDTEKVLRRQIPVPTPARGGPRRDAGVAARAGPERWFSSRRDRMRVEACVAAGSLVMLLGPATAMYVVYEVVGVALFVTAAMTMLLALGAIYIESLLSCESDGQEDESERAVARLVSGGGIDASE